MSEITLEQVEKIRARAQVSYEEAKAALEAAGGDPLDAMIWLERRGRRASEPQDASHSGFYSTQGGGSGSSAEPLFTERAAGYPGLLRDLLHRSMTIQFEVWRQERRVIGMPVLIGILLLLVAPWVCGPLLLVGLLAGCRYGFARPEEEGGNG